jgi:hypothetical protein
LQASQAAVVQQTPDPQKVSPNVVCTMHANLYLTLHLLLPCNVAALVAMMLSRHVAGS